MATVEFVELKPGGAIISAEPLVYKPESITLQQILDLLQSPQKVATEITTIKELLPRVVLVNRVVLINDEGRTLVIQRSQEDSWQPGLWELPGGKQDPGQSFEDALERELFEETRLTMIRLSRAAHVDGKLLTKGKYAGFPYMQITGVGRLSGGRLRLSDEHQNYRWVTIDGFYELETSPESYKAVSEMENDLKTKYGAI